MLARSSDRTRWLRLAVMLVVASCSIAALLIGLRRADPVAAGSASDAVRVSLGGPLQAPGNPILYPSPITHTAPLTTVVSITYDEPIDPSTVTSVTFAVHGMQSGLVTATHGNTIVVTPTRPFHQGELVYAIATTRTLNITGTGPLTATQWQFNAGVVRDRCLAGFTEVYAGSLTGVAWGSSVAWGDYDNDGDLDILLTGGTGSGDVSKVYRNTGSGFSEVYAGSLTSVQWGSVAWGDYDNDGDLDILLTGDTGSGYVSKVYRNTGSGFSEVYSGSLTGVMYSSVAWGDYDNDGDLDILLTGDAGSSGPVSKVYRNTGSGFTEIYTGSLTGVSDSSVAWGDYDNDGDLDILLTGMDSGGTRHSKVYRNTDSGFSEVYTGSLTGVSSSSVAWGDYDNDGDLDILLTGEDSSSTPVSKVYRNTGSGFSEVYTGSLTGVIYSSVAWGDYDNDGDLDILLTGDSGSNTPISKVYRNTGSGFSEVYAGSLTDVYMGSVAWGDYDNDGDLDVLLTGYDVTTCHTKVYRNDDCPKLTGIAPPRNAHTAALTTTITATYNQDIDASTVTSVTFAVHGMQSGLVTATHGVVSGNTIVVTPTRPFHQGELVYAIATTGTLNITGTGPLTATQWQFNAGVVTTRCVGGFSEVYTGSLTGVSGSSVAWGDYDNDGDLDILLTGDTGTDYVSKVYENTGSGFTEVYPGSLTDVRYSSVAWGDYDNDGDLDILLTGDTGSGYVSKVYRNTGSGFTEVYPGSLAGVWQGSVAWGDYDNDGDLDILLTGGTSGTWPFDPIAKVYRNTGSGFTEVYSGSLTGVGVGSVAWGDYDNDGDLDILLTGFDGGSSRHAKVYHNTGNGFGEVYPGSLTGVDSSSVAWGDYDNDGDLDILLTGDDGGSYIARIYQNTESGFSEVYPGSLTDVGVGSVAWGDYDNDGDLDILLTGWDDSNRHAKVYRNTGSGFTEVYPGSLTGVDSSSVAWGDYDNDGDLDILLAGDSISSGRITKIYRNDDCPPDLAIAKSVIPTQATPEQPITYTLAVFNTGGLATNLVITDALPAGANYVSGGTRVGNVVSWTAASLPFSASMQVTFVVTAADTITNDDYWVSADGNVSAVGQEPVVVMVGIPAISAAKTVKPGGTVQSGDLLTYTVTISNPGTLDVFDLYLWDTVPTTTEHISGTLIGGATYSATTRAIRWKGDALAFPGHGPGYTLDQIPYVWESIETSGTEITAWQGTSNNGYAGPIPLGFALPYFDLTHVYTQVYVSTNGFIGFGPPTGYTAVPAAVPDPSVPNNAILAYGDDLQILQGISHVYYYSLNDPERLVVSYIQVWDGGSGGYYTFQIILYPTGEIRFSYQDQAAADAIGIENTDGSRGLAYPTPSFVGSRSLLFRPTEYRRFIYQARVREDLTEDQWVTNTVILTSSLDTVLTFASVRVEVPPDSYEPNDDCSQAVPISATTVLTSYISRVDDVDVYRVEITQPYTVISLTLASPPDAEAATGLRHATGSPGWARARRSSITLAPTRVPTISSSRASTARGAHLPTRSPSTPGRANRAPTPTSPTTPVTWRRRLSLRRRSRRRSRRSATPTTMSLTCRMPTHRSSSR
jgi:uncharacterized repeat protein (TIGR01451 family)